jgi:predicted choloylglycine hydrolase
MRLAFQAIHEERPGPKWAARFARTWPAYQAWFLRDGVAERPSYLQCRSALEQHAPRLLGLWETLCELAGGGDLAARFLSLYCPTPLFSGCSQAVWTRDDRPLLIRNYDYHPRACEGTLLKSAWHGTKVIASIDCSWGVLDGINEHGLCVALAFGGQRHVGGGFGIQLHLRYVLEFCRTTEEATQVLCSIPSSMAYNVSVLDAEGKYGVVLVGPNRRPRVIGSAVATNHQERVEWQQHDTLTRSAARRRVLQECLRDPAETAASLRSRFLAPPLFSTAYDRSFGTLYTAVYDAKARSAEFLWRTGSWRLAFDDFREGTFRADYSLPV